MHRPLLHLAAAAGVGILTLTGCTSGDDVVRMWIEPDVVECDIGSGPWICLQVSYTEDGPPELFYDGIDGFTFQEGTSYVIDVKVTEVENPPQDASSVKYTLVEVISEE